MNPQQTEPLVALAGNPNSGKTALFNAMTGSRQKVANYPGVTVEKKEGIARSPSGKFFRILDLPGLYSLNAQSPDEEVSRDILLHHEEKLSEDPDAVVVVVDATHLERNLGLALELRALDKPFIIALNMMDLASKRGLDIDLAALERAIGAPVVPTVAVKKIGIEKLLTQIESRVSLQKPEQKSEQNSKKKLEAVSITPESVSQRFQEVDRILKAVTRRMPIRHAWTDRIDRIVLHPIAGFTILLSVLFLVFQAVFTWSEAPIGWIESAMTSLGITVSQTLPEGPLSSLLVDGVIAGVGSVVVFLPQILLLFFFVLLLEDSGYMARAAFLMDRLMGKVGLHGRAFIPLLSSFACAIPGIMATRTIENRRDRLVTIMVAPLMTCSARLPVYTLLIGAFIPNETVMGLFDLRGVVMFGLYLAAVVSALVVAAVLKGTLLQGAPAGFLMEMPTYKRPSMTNLFMGLWERARLFLRRAGTIILSLSIILWFLASYPKAPDGATEPAITYSFAGKIGAAIEPLVRPVGFDWRIATGMVPGFAAREVMVGALATVFAIEASDDETKTGAALGDQIKGAWGLATALSLLAWYIFAPQCLSTLAIVRRETNSWRWTIFMLFYLTALAYLASFSVYRAALALGL